MDNATLPHLPTPPGEESEAARANDPGLTQRGASHREFTVPALPRHAQAADNHATSLPTSFNDQATVQNRAIPSPVLGAPGTPAPARPAANRLNNWTLVMIAMAALSITLVCGLIALVSARAMQAGGTPDPIGSEAASLPSATPPPTFPVPTATVGLEIQPWDGKERFNVLLMGLDKRPGESGTAFRTDSMILISLDPATSSIGMLSIPRDLYVEIPPKTIVGSGYGLQRVNSAYVIGELVKPGYGPQLAMQTVQYNLGIRVNDYVVYDFTTVITLINAVGGIDIDVASAIRDFSYPNMYFGYETLYIPAGRIHMNGDLALKYARTRHGTSDFDRAKRQQQVITAVKDRVFDLNMAPELLVKAPGLWSQLSRNVRSGLTFDQLLRLAIYAKDVPRENIHQGVLDIGYVTPINWNGQAVLVPNRASIGPLLVQVFGRNYNR
jgi:LCP family protein required for cell wall assembly